MAFLSNLVVNLLFLFFNLGIFYAIYWGFREDSKIEEKNKPKSSYYNRK